MGLGVFAVLVAVVVVVVGGASNIFMMSLQYL